MSHIRPYADFTPQELTASRDHWASKGTEGAYPRRQFAAELAYRKEQDHAEAMAWAAKIGGHESYPLNLSDLLANMHYRSGVPTTDWRYQAGVAEMRRINALNNAARLEK